MRYGAHPWTLRQLQYAVAVAELKSFRRAAEQCHVSQPSLSAQLAQLERALGVQLFERDRRRVLSTRAGEQLVERARRILLEADDLLEAARGLADPQAATLKVGVIPTLSPYLLPEIAPALKREHPRLSVLWLEAQTAQVLARLESGELDAGLLAMVGGLEHLEQEVVGDDAFVLATPRDHPLARSKKPVALRELAGHELLLLDDGHCFRDQALEVCKGARTGEAGFRATSLTTLAQMVASGAGITLLPEIALAAENPHGRLAIRSFAPPVPHRTLAVAWRRASPLAAAARALAGTVARTLAARRAR